MKTTLYIMLALILASIAYAEVITLDWQGKHQNTSDGTDLNGTFHYNISIFNQSNDAFLYGENNSVDVAYGVFNYVVGNLVALDPKLFRYGVYMQAKIVDDVFTSKNISIVPRAGWAFYCNDSIYLDGTIASSYTTDTELTSANASIIDFVFNGSFAYWPEIESAIDNNISAFNSSTIHYWNTSWITTNQNVNTSTEMWNAANNGSFYYRDQVHSLIDSNISSLVYNTTSDIRAVFSNSSNITYDQANGVFFFNGTDATVANCSTQYSCSDVVYGGNSTYVKNHQNYWNSTDLSVKQVNVTLYNVTDVDCIIFSTGGKICGS